MSAVVRKLRLSRWWLVVASFACQGDPAALREGPPQARNPQLTTIKFVQVAAATPQADSDSVTVNYGAAQAAGDLNVVVVGWNDTNAAVTSIADTNGNAYARAVGPTAYPGQLTQSIYYARNIVAASPGANSVTVNFNVRARYVDIRILEYSGVDTTAPLDATAAAVGSDALTDSGPLTTTDPNELLVAANTVTGVTQGPGAGFTKRIITTPDGDIAEDQVAASAGTYRGTAPNTPGFWVMQMVAFRSTGVQPPPTAPGNLTATAASSTKVDLAWTASSSSLGIAGYRVERCQGAACTNFTQIGAPTGTSFPDASCSANGAYRYRVRAVDSAGNLSDWSNIADAATPSDTQPPAAPANLVATAASSGQINLTWTASTDNVAVIGYLLERCQGNGCTGFTQIATPAATNYSNAELSASTTYGYRVRATDAAGNLSSYSAAAFATTHAGTQPPTPPSNFAATARNASQIDLTWSASTSSVGIANYLVERCQGSGCTNFAQISTPATTGYSDTGLLGSTTYGYRVRARDVAGNMSDYSNSASATTPAPASTATPTLVQHVSSSTDPEAFAETGNAYVFTLPNEVLAGNCLILGISVGWTATRTVAITDDNGNVWPSSAAVTTSDGANSISSIYVLPNANAGTTTITVTFDGGAARVKGFQYTISEFYNVATVSPVNGTSKSSTTAAPNLASGSFTPGNNNANGGNLIWSYFSDNVGTSPNRVTSFAAVGGFALLDADIAWDRSAGFFHASEYFVQATSAPVNPGMTAAGSTDRYNAVSVALKAASVGTAPAATGIRIIRVSHQTCDVPPSTWPLQFPSSSGNLIVVTTVPDDVLDISSISDTRSNDYTNATLSSGDPGLWYAAAAMPDPTLTITLHMRGTPVNATVVILEIAGAATVPVDGAAEVTTQGDPNGRDLFDTPVITPASANGLTIAQLTLGTGPSNGMAPGSPTGAVFDFVHFTGQTDGSKMDNSDGLAHVYNTDLSTQHWNWIVDTGGITTNYAALAVHFKAAP